MRLINARYKLNEEEIDFLIAVIESIKEDKISLDIKEYDFKFIKKIVSKTLEISTADGQDFINWFTKIECITTESTLNVILEEEIRDFLIKLSSDLSSIDLKYFFSLSSNYSRAIYKLLKTYEHKSQTVVNLEELKNRLQIPKGLQLYSNFKIKVLNIAQQEIRENTDISFSLEEKKDGKKVNSLVFTINRENTLEKKIEIKSPVVDVLEPKQEKKEEVVVKNVSRALSKESTVLNEEIKRVVTFFDYERKKLQANFSRKEYRNLDGEWLLRTHLKETNRTPVMFFDAIRWLFSSNPQATFHRQYIMNIGKLIEHFNTLEHQAMYSKESLQFNEEAQSWYNIFKKQGLKEDEILEKLKEGGFIK